MKHRPFHLFALVLSLLLVLLPQRAEAAGASLTGSASLRAGSTVTLTLSVNSSGVYAVDTDLRYDATMLELLSYKPLLDGWKMDQKAAGGFLLEDPTLSTPVEGNAKLFSLTFRVKNGVSAGSTVSVSVNNIKASGEDSSVSLGNASWSASVLAPLSGDATLKTLSCAGTDLTFTGGTEYRLTVPYETAALKLSYTTSHSGAKASVSGSNLSVGDNTVTVTVTAENGAVKRYYLYVTRQQDPNYVPSNDAVLASLQPSAGILSPAFDPSITEYAVYLPYETQTLTLTATARSDKAQSARQIGDSTLAEGETLLVLRCVAEDGTVKDYRVHALRMPLFTGVLPEISAPEAGTPLPDIPAVEPEPDSDTYDLSLPLQLTVPVLGEITLQQAAIGVLAAAALLLLLLLLLFWALGRRSGRKKTLRHSAAPDPVPVTEEVAAEAITVEEATPPAQPAGEMSIDDLLEDIRNM